MDPERWERVKTVFSELVDSTAADREQLLRDVDEDIREDVKRLLSGSQAVEESGGLLSRPLMGSSRFVEWLADPRVYETGQVLLERFEVVRLLGRGGMGEVYEAIDRTLKEPVAIKTIRYDLADDESIAVRFRGEVRRARKVTHDHVCRVFDLFSAPGVDGREMPFFTMELLYGTTCYARVSETGPLTGEQALPLAVQICQGLEAAHRVGVIHRDLKSANIILVRQEGGTEIAKITDFGLALPQSSPDQVVKAALSGALSGTLPYMAPELVAGGGATIASDIYALGVVLHRMVTGQYPTVEGGAAPPPEWRGGLRAALESDPARRPSSAGALSALLDPPAEVPRASRRARFSRRSLMGTAVAGMGVSTLSGWVWHLKSGPLVKAAHSAALVEDFESADPGGAFGRAVRNMVKLALRRTPHLTVLRPEAVRLAATALDADTAPLRGPVALAVARKAQATLSIGGKATRSNDGATIEVRVRLASTGEVLFSTSETATQRRPLAGAVGLAAAHLVERLFGASGEGADVEPAETDTPEALEAFTAALDYYHQGEPQPAIALLEDAVRADPGFAMAYSYLSVIQSALRREDLAFEAALQAYRLRDRVNERQRQQADVMYLGLSGDQARYLDALRAAVAKYPGDAPLHRQLAQACCLLEQLDEAIVQARMAVELDGRSPINHMIYVSAFAQAGRTGEALQALAKARSVGDSPLLDSSDCLIRLVQDDFPAAMAAVRGIRRGKDLQAHARLFEMRALLMAGRLEEAMSLLETEGVVERAGVDAANLDMARHFQAQLLLERGNRAGALEAAAELLGRPAVPPFAGAFRAAAETAWEAGDVTALRKATGKIDELKAKFGGTRLAGIGLQLHGFEASLKRRPDEAVRLLEQAHSVWPDLLNTWSLAMEKLAAGDAASALPLFGDVIARKGTAMRWEHQVHWLRSLVQAARCYRAMGMQSQAVTLYDRFLGYWGKESDLPLVAQARAERLG